MISHSSYFVVCLTFIILLCFMTKTSETHDYRTNQSKIAVFVCDLKEMTGPQLFGQSPAFPVYNSNDMIRIPQSSPLAIPAAPPWLMTTNYSRGIIRDALASDAIGISELILQLLKCFFCVMFDDSATASVCELELTHASGRSKQAWHIPDAVCTVLNTWWWAEKPPETCRALTVIKTIV